MRLCLKFYLCQPQSGHVPPSTSLDQLPFEPPIPGSHPCSVATAQARQGPHGSQHQLRPLSVHKLQQQSHSIALEDPLSPCFFTAQDNEVVGSLREKQWKLLGSQRKALTLNPVQRLIHRLYLQNVGIFSPPWLPAENSLLLTAHRTHTPVAGN